MKKLNSDSPLLLGMIATLLSLTFFYFIEHRLDENQYLYGFLFNFMPVQLLNTSLFLIAILFVVIRSRNYWLEAQLVERLSISDNSISYNDAEQLLAEIPKQYSHSKCYRRLSDVLRGFLCGEDIIRLNEELSHRDLGEVDRGHLLLNSMRQIIPVVGFLGTVVGLSEGMAKFPEISAKVGNIVDLKELLKGFAADLSVAFDTTLLALAYTIVVILIASMLKGKEQAHIALIDERTRELVAKLKGKQTRSDHSSGASDVAGVAEVFQAQFREVMESFNDVWQKTFSSKMDELIDQVRH